MDEMWQRHKSFILQLFLGGVVFLVLFFVMRSNYGDSHDPEQIQKKNKSRLEELEGKSRQGKAPSTSVIAEQKVVAEKAAAAKWALVDRVASRGGRDPKSKDADREKAYVKESITAVLDVIGKKYDDHWLELYDRLPQACLSSVGQEARTALVGRAAQSGKEIDELLGLGGGFQSDEIPEVLQGFAVETDVVSRFLAKPRISRITNIRITPHGAFPENNGILFMGAVGVHLEVVGHPADVYDVLRSFNGTDRKEGRMVVLESVEQISPLSPDEDDVRAVINVVGLRYKQVAEQGGE
jgi:hypothetical protein